MNNFYDAVYIGHYTKDTIKYADGRQVTVDGGGFNYGINVALSLGLKTAAVTRLSEKDIHVKHNLEAKGADVYAYFSEFSTCNEFRYNNASLDKREMYISSMAASFRPEDIKGIKAGTYILGPNIYGEMTYDFVKAVKDEGGLVSLDVQGFVRACRDGKVEYAEWNEAERNPILGLVDVVKTDLLEANMLTGISDKYDAAKAIIKMGPGEVVLTSENGVLVYDGTDFHEYDFRPDKIRGRSGRGDTCVSSYMIFRKNNSPEIAGRYAAAITSMKLEKEGFFDRKISEVEDFIAKNYS